MTYSSISRPRPRWSLLFLVVTLAVVACGADTVPTIERVRPVKYVTVQSGASALQERVFAGTAQAGQESRVSFNVAGKVNQLPVSVGDSLAPGQLIAALDPATYEVEVQRSRAAVSQADAERRNAESEYQRIRQLYANTNASQNDLEASLSRTESAEANYQAMRQALELAKLNRAYTELKAATHCSIAALNVELNENVAAGSQVAVVNCGDRWEVNIAVPESLIGAFSSGLIGRATFNAIPGETFLGSVSEVGIAGGDDTTYTVTLVLEQQHPTLRSGLAADVTFTLPQGEEGQISGNRFYLPPVSVGQDEQGTFVFILMPTDEAGIFTTNRRSVVVGSLNNLGLEIIEGLKDGEKVITAGVTAARNGLRVKVE